MTSAVATNTAAPKAAPSVSSTRPSRSASIIAGISLALMAVLAGFANFGVFEALVVPGDATATAANIAGSETLFRVGVSALVVVVLLLTGRL